MTSLPCVCKITESNIYRDQASKQNEENWIKFFTAPRKIGVVSFTLKCAAHYFFFLHFCFLIKSQKQKGFSSMGKTTVQMEGEMAAVPCHHGGDIRAWWRSSQSRKHMPHLNEASAIQLYRQLARGKSGSVFTDLSHFKTLPQRLFKPN